MDKTTLATTLLPLGTAITIAKAALIGTDGNRFIGKVPSNSYTC